MVEIGDDVADKTEQPKEIREDYDFSIYEEGETKFQPTPVLGDKHHPPGWWR